MTKYAGLVGYATQEEIRPGVWSDTITEVFMRGDVLRLAGSHSSGEKVNDDLTLQNRISLIGSPYAYKNFLNIKYVTYMGVRWKVLGVEVPRPRLIISLGGVWNG